jgi:hypothetical protein
MKSNIYIILTLLKVIVITIGMVYAFINFRSWRKTKDSKKFKKAAILFGGVVLSILIISGVEIIIAFN